MNEQVQKELAYFEQRLTEVGAEVADAEAELVNAPAYLVHATKQLIIRRKDEYQELLERVERLKDWIKANPVCIGCCEHVPALEAVYYTETSVVCLKCVEIDLAIWEYDEREPMYKYWGSHNSPLTPRG